MRRCKAFLFDLLSPGKHFSLVPTPTTTTFINVWFRFYGFSRITWRSWFNVSMDIAIAIFRINEAEARLGSKVSHWKLGVGGGGQLKRWSNFSTQPGYTLKAEIVHEIHAAPPPIQKKNYKREYCNTSWTLEGIPPALINRGINEF